MGLTAIVNSSPGVGRANQSGVRASLPVIASPHQATGQAINWLLGRGHPLAVSGPVEMPAEDTTYFSFWVHPDDLHPNFWWLISATVVDGYGQPKSIGVYVDTTIHYPDPGTERTKFSTKDDGSSITLAVREDVLPSNTPQEIHCTITTDFVDPGPELGADKYFYLLINGVHVVEAPQVRVDGYGVPLSTLESRQPIYWDGSTDPPRQNISSISKIATLAHTSYARRGSMFSWYDPLGPATTGESGDYTPVFPVKPALQCRHISLGQTRGTVRVNVAASIVGDGHGYVKFTMTTGDSIEFDVTSSLTEWIGEQEMLVATDDPSRWPADGGQRGGVRDEMLVEMKAPDGGTINVRGICISEAPTSGGEDESANVLVMGGTPITYGGEYIFIPVPYPP